jgi:hypothetical protein
MRPGLRVAAVGVALAVGGLALGAAGPAGTRVDTGIASAANGAEQLRLARVAMGPSFDRLMAHLPEEAPEGLVPLHAIWSDGDGDESPPFTPPGSLDIYYGRDGELPRLHAHLDETSEHEGAADVAREIQNFWREREQDPSLRGGGPSVSLVDIGGWTWAASGPGRNTLRFWGYGTVLPDHTGVSVSDWEGGVLARRFAEAVARRLAGVARS